MKLFGYRIKIMRAQCTSVRNMVDLFYDSLSDESSIVLFGSYIEEKYAYIPQEGIPLPPIVKRKRGFLRGSYHPAALPWRGHVPERCWLLIIRPVKATREDWGFWSTREGIVGRQQIPVGDNVVELITRGQVAYWINASTYYKSFFKQGGLL